MWLPARNLVHFVNVYSPTNGTEGPWNLEDKDSLEPPGHLSCKHSESRQAILLQGSPYLPSSKGFQMDVHLGG